MRAASTLIAIGTALSVMSAGPARALGFGRVVNSTQLGQPLNFSATVRVDGDEALPRECVSAEVQSGDGKLAPGAVRVTLEDGPDAAERNVRVTTGVLIDEPVVAVSVTLGCGAKITRRFVVFVDPPLINAALAGAESPEALSPQRVDSPVAPIVRLVQSDRPARTATAASRAAAGRMATASPRRTPAHTEARTRSSGSTSNRVAAAATSSAPAARAAALSPATRVAKRVVTGGPPATVSGSRLQLESAAALARPSSAGAASAAVTPAPVAVPPVASSLAASTSTATTMPASTLAASTLAASAPAEALSSAGAGAGSGSLPAAAVAPIDSKPAQAGAENAAIAQLAVERERFHALEADLAKLRADALSTQQSLAALQGRLQQSESERHANPLTYALASLSALLAFVVAALWWRQSRHRDTSPWWTAPASIAPSPHEPATPTPDLASVPESPSAEPTAAAASANGGGLDQPSLAATAVPVADASPRAAVPVIPPRASEAPRAVSGGQAAASPHVPAAAASVEGANRPSATSQRSAASPASMANAVTSADVAYRPHLPSPLPASSRELSVEELIDLEQQAEFFIVLGQDEAAIDLLMSHVRSDGGISPLPYLKLLEIYRRRGEREAYERIRERFNRRFNAHAADWDSDLQKGRALVDYPETVSRLQSLWRTPPRVMETLDASLFRRHHDGETFDLPAYRELLFLYSVARDLAEQGAGAQPSDVDLMLPIDAAADAPISRLSPTGHGEFLNSDLLTMPLDLDVSLEPRGAAVPPGPANDFPSVPAPDVDPRALEPVDSDADTTPSALRRSAPIPLFDDSRSLDLDLTAPGGLPYQPDLIRRG